MTDIRTIFAALALLTPLPAAAQVTQMVCSFDRQCYADGDCTPISDRYTFTLDLTNGTGRMESEGFATTGLVTQAGGMIHYLMANDAGSEMVSFNQQGGVAYTGHLGGQPEFYLYWLYGTCKGRPGS